MNEFSGAEELRNKFEYEWNIEIVFFRDVCSTESLHTSEIPCGISTVLCDSFCSQFYLRYENKLSNEILFSME